MAAPGKPRRAATSRKPQSTAAAQLAVLAAADERAYAAGASDLLAAGDRLAREATLAALIERPAPAARDALRALYATLAADGPKRDQGARLRTGIIRALARIRDARDADIAAAAADTFERILGDDVSWELRVHGLRLLADLAPDTFPFVAIEHLDDFDEVAVRGMEPANTAFQLLAATGQFAVLYQWLLAAERPPALAAAVLSLLAEGPRTAVARYVARAAADAVRRADDPFAMTLAEAIVRLELAESYPALARLLSAKISDELYRYLVLLLAGTGRAELLAVLEEQLRGGRRPSLVAEALRARPTPEHLALLRRWEDGAAEES